MEYTRIWTLYVRSALEGPGRTSAAKQARLYDVNAEVAYKARLWLK